MWPRIHLVREQEIPDPPYGYLPIPEDKVVVTFWEVVESLHSFPYHKGKGQVKQIK